MGRKAYGAPSVGGLDRLGGCSPDLKDNAALQEDEYNDDEESYTGRDSKHKGSGIGIAPIVAYAKSQGLPPSACSIADLSSLVSRR